MNKENENNFSPVQSATNTNNEIVNNINDVCKTEKISNNLDAKTKLNNLSQTNNSNTNGKKELTAYQKFLYCKNAGYEKYKQKYFEFYDDVKDKTHRIYDW